jgi:hypothetical protein
MKNVSLSQSPSLQQRSEFVVATPPTTTTITTTPTMGHSILSRDVIINIPPPAPKPSRRFLLDIIPNVPITTTTTSTSGSHRINATTKIPRNLFLPDISSEYHNNNTANNSSTNIKQHGDGTSRLPAIRLRRRPRHQQRVRWSHRALVATKATGAKKTSTTMTVGSLLHHHSRVVNEREGSWQSMVGMKTPPVRTLPFLDHDWAWSVVPNNDSSQISNITINNKINKSRSSNSSSRNCMGNTLIFRSINGHDHLLVMTPTTNHNNDNNIKQRSSSFSMSRPLQERN